MSSVNKKKKLKNSHLCGSGLKIKTKLKGICFYNSSVRQDLNKQPFEIIKEVKIIENNG